MVELPEFLIDVTVVYADGQAETITLKHRDLDEQTALETVQDQFSAFMSNENIESLTTTINNMRSAA